MKVGFLGLGNMGEPMAMNLIQAGHSLTVWNRSAGKTQRLADIGARVAKDVTEASANEVVCSMVADDHALEQVLNHGLLEALPKGSVHVSLSTISVQMAERLKALHQERQQLYVSAPVFGRPEAAAAKKLWVVAAGESTALAKVRPLLEAIGQKLLELGEDPIQANITKISGNFLIGAALEAMGEAVALVRKYGVDPAKYMEFLTTTLFASPIYQGYGTKIAKGEYEPVAFRAALGVKDIRLALAAGEAKRAPMPLAGMLQQNLLTAIARYGEDLDWSAIGRLAADNAGLEKEGN